MYKTGGARSEKESGFEGEARKNIWVGGLFILNLFEPERIFKLETRACGPSNAIAQSYFFSFYILRLSMCVCVFFFFRPFVFFDISVIDSDVLSSCILFCVKIQ